MENHDGEARHHGLTGDPGDEQLLCSASFEHYGGAITIKCVLPVGHTGKHSTGGTLEWPEEVETPEWLKDNPHPDLPETCYTKEECSKRIRDGGPISCRRQPACSS